MHRTTWWRMRTNSPEIEERKSYYSSLRRLLTGRVRGASQDKQHQQPEQHANPTRKLQSSCGSSASMSLRAVASVGPPAARSSRTRSAPALVRLLAKKKHAA